MSDTMKRTTLAACPDRSGVDPTDCRRRPRAMRDDAFGRRVKAEREAAAGGAGKRWLRVTAGLLWAPNNNEFPVGCDGNDRK